MTDGAPSRTTPNLLTPVSADMPATQVLNDIVRTAMHPVLKAEGFRKSGRTWREGDAERGWVLLQIQGSKFNTRERVEMILNVGVWPPGTWEVSKDVSGWKEALPYVAGGTPFFARPGDIAPGRPSVAGWWQIDSSTDVDAVAAGMVDFTIDDALPWARQRRDPDRAVRALLAQGRLVYAIAVLRRTAAGSAQLRDTVEQLTSEWIHDPRPITLRPLIIQWRQEAGLPEVPLS